MEDMEDLEAVAGAEHDDEMVQDAIGRGQIGLWDARIEQARRVVRVLKALAGRADALASRADTLASRIDTLAARGKSLEDRVTELEARIGNE